MISKSTFQFLKDIRKNNNKEWFIEHKALYLDANENTSGSIIMSFKYAIIYLQPFKRLVFSILFNFSYLHPALQASYRDVA